MKYYLAYGSNLSVEQMLQRCPQAVYVGKTSLEGYRLIFRGSRTGYYLTIEPAEGSSVPCLVWRVEEEDERALDIYEGYPQFYRKEEMPVALMDLAFGKEVGQVQAFVYVMVEGRPAGRPTARYFATVLKGYQRFGLDDGILVRAFDDSIEEASDD